MPAASLRMTAFVNGTARSSGARRGVGVAELVRTESQRRSNGSIELAHGPLAEGLDRVVQRAHALDGAVRKPLRECALPLVELARGGAEDTVGVGVLLEDPEQYLV